MKGNRHTNVQLSVLPSVLAFSSGSASLAERAAFHSPKTSTCKRRSTILLVLLFLFSLSHLSFGQEGLDPLPPDADAVLNPEDDSLGPAESPQDLPPIDEVTRGPLSSSPRSGPLFQPPESRASATEVEDLPDLPTIEAEVAPEMSNLTEEKIADAVAAALEQFQKGQEQAMNLTWVLICGFLVMFMQAGFAMVETGFTRAKNVAHTMAMNFMVYALGMLGFWISGFAIQFGGMGDPNSVNAISSLGEDAPELLNSMLGIDVGGNYFGLMGQKGFFLHGEFLVGSVFTLFLFQMVFMDAAATIPTGAMAERWKFGAFMIASFCVGAFIYPIYACWVWGGGWLAALGQTFGLGHGHVDFAGSSVVHLTGGVLGFVGAAMLGPRYGKYNFDKTANPIPAHNLAMGFLGTFILAFGWFGFNAGSTLSATDAQIGIIATNTMLSSAAGAVMATFVTSLAFKKPDPSFMCNGMLAGLVGITGSCAFVDAWAAVVIGSISGCLVVGAALFVERKVRVDDPCGAIAVHGVCGIWGVLAVGLFANGTYGDGWNGVEGNVTGLLYNGDTTQLAAQAIGAGSCILAVGFMAFVVYGLCRVTIGLRSDIRDEIAGLDAAELGALGYQPDLNPDPH
ncbi:MAG: ammonium transporter [Verrucomicrobiales bacterium]